MSLQALWALFLAHPAQAVNGLALFFGVAGAWLLLATRARERRALARWAAEGEAGEAGEAALPMDEATLRINLFFYRFGTACLGLALLVSWASTRL
ncbi:MULTISPECIES: hypothetical protein [Pseudomonas]|uniref:hypothetical protein n=1 Tax=Pseudomonas TaxID=286 RepID=UPI00022F2C7E|nr:MULTISPECIES: hypothetical protein [Pseudomonas]KEA11553.1 hypothetical protein BH78_07280 [Pseudomonas aeruginosa C1913C]SSV53336.1 Uncharacterised protein [Acinetobacter baumannii]AGO42129.1 hypothetical protein M062_24425 [Pseudomonas aeruginosa RP73]AHA18484.2 hypothetical protein PA1S_25140 [Pseudomonas aeruginosa PA1]ALE50666.1 hypothetical protein AOD73_25235 [Pseudomonas aeruginosa]